MSRSRQKISDLPVESDGVISGLTVEARDERVHVWITPEFTATHAGARYQGVALSLEGFEIDRRSLPKQGKGAIEFTLRLDVGGFNLEVPVKAAPEGEVERNGRPAFLYCFTELTNGERDALRRFIRAHLSGHIVTVDDVIRKSNSPTRVRASARKGHRRNDGGNAVTRTIRRIFNLGVALVVFGGIVTIGGFAIYERMTIVQGSFAAVTAPRIELLAPATGQLVVSGPQAGERVERDQELVRITSLDLDADIIVARARVRAINNSIERANLAALELRQAGNTLYSPCECAVLWAAENTAWARRGDRLFTLARTAPDDLRVETLMHLRDVNRLYRGQTAYVSWPETDVISEGVIEVIALDGDRQARVGFPEWLRRDQSMVSVMISLNEPLDPNMIGLPVDVFVRTEPPFLHRVTQVLWSVGNGSDSEQDIVIENGEDTELAVAP